MVIIARIVEILIRCDNRTAIRSLRELGLASERTSRQIGESWRRTGSAMQGVGRAMTGIGVGVGYFGYQSVKSAMNFQTAMTRIQTQAGVSGKTVDKMSRAVLALGGSGQVQYGPTQLANALYHIESVATGNTVPGLHDVSTAMSVLKTASMGAAIGGSDLEQTTTALMGAMAAMHAPANQAQSVMALLNSTVGAGNMRMQDLVQALGRGVIPAFQNVGMSAKDAFAAIALTSDQGTQASSAAAQLATALHYLADPTTKASKMFAGLGLSAAQLGKDTYGPGGLLKGLTDVQNVLANLPGWQRAKAIFTLMPAGRGRVLQQVLNNLTAYGNKLTAISPDVAKFQAAYQVQQNTFSGKLHTAWAKINTDMTKFGAALIPIIEKYLPKLLRHLEDFFKWLNGLSPAAKNLITLLTAGFIIGGPILWGLGRAVSLVGQMATMFRGVYGAAKAVLPLLARINGFGGFDIFGGGGKGSGGKGGGKGGSGGTPRSTTGFFPAGGVPRGTEKAAQQAEKDAGKLAKASRIVKGIGKLGIFVPFAGEVILAGQIAEMLGLRARKGAIPRSKSPYYTPRFGAHGGLVTSDGIRRFQSGGLVGYGTDTVPAALTPGEGILNRVAMTNLGVPGLAAMNAGNFDAGGIVIESAPVYIVLDGRVVARSVLQQTLRKAARGPSGLIGGAIATGAPVNLH